MKEHIVKHFDIFGIRFQYMNYLDHFGPWYMSDKSGYGWAFDIFKIRILKIKKGKV